MLKHHVVCLLPLSRHHVSWRLIGLGCHTASVHLASSPLQCAVGGCASTNHCIAASQEEMHV